MNNKMEAYIDSFEMITLLLDKSMSPHNKRFFILDDGIKYHLATVDIIYEENHYKFILQNISKMELHKEYYICDEKNNSCPLYSGSVVRSKEFDEKYRYEGPLGAEYSKEATTFRVWSPVAKEIYVEVEDKNGKKKRCDMNYMYNGMWSVTVKGNLDGFLYLLYVRVFDEFKAVHDPYAIASNANGLKNYVVDKNKFYKMKYSKPDFSGIYTDAIIYEASVRDFTYNLKGDLKGTFLGMVENNPTKKDDTGLKYISSLGITHLQLMPTYDFGGVDDLAKDAFYNWGYNPEQYFVPNGWYSKNPDDPYSRINELKELIDNVHKFGMRVSMDVVFNHVYKFEEFAFDYLVPGYFYRIEFDGKMSNASSCGNDLATERYMCSRFIIDVLKYYAKEYNVSAFRFDLMGLLDIDTLNQAYTELKKIEHSIMLYGEGWNMNNPLPDEFRPHMFNHKKIPQYAFFNDRYRNFIRGNQWNKDYGYVYGIGDCNFDLYHLASGSCLDYYKFNEPTQSINYVECHDNYTMFDFGVTHLELSEEEAISAAKLALQIIIVSFGIPFIHAGEEFYRTKKGIENSYNRSDSINKFDYARRDTYIEDIKILKDLIDIRKKYPHFRLSKTSDIRHKTHMLEGLSGENVLTYLIEGEKDNIVVIIKNNNEVLKFSIDKVTQIFTPKGKCELVGTDFEIKDEGVYIYKEVK